MRAVWLTGLGGPEVLVAGEAPDPAPGDGRALVAVEFANITFVETQMRAGGPSPFTVEPPVIPGNGVGGVVTAVGAGADPALVGRRVVSATGGSGGYAELAAVDAAGVFEVPDGLALDDAVALLADGRTATMMLRAAGPRPGERVLVEAAAGGVGTLLVQLAKAAGAVVVAAVGGARKAEVARGLGADEVVDYREPGWTAGVGAVDVVFDGVGGGVAREAFTLLRGGGRMVSFGLASGEWAQVPEGDAAARGVTLVRPEATPEEMRGFTETVLADAARGMVRPLIGQRYPLADAAGAHAAIESRATVGKTLLEVRR
ncbi:zinc-binding dehydrogenase [Actinomadura sp. WMMB 499]|uniref:zinc-binding dehydrogenase n=1 Tax=Actinomadura sp. WMMB 499 TaxID=1219491 RepID=UPI001243A493|nr:zinc-binding dehydrogenase [Actinomadura sp. WMMB 499]QFG24905.1 zinc-binding dehydrogenase [Actinomadura sp. WMMB 499]